MVAAGLVAADYSDFALIAYHFNNGRILAPAWIPPFALAMAVQAIAALVFGRLFDRFGISVLFASVVVSAAFAPFVFLGHSVAAILGMVFWGVGIGAQDTILRAVIATIVAPVRRASAYGVFNAGFGLAWFLGSVLMGYLYDISLVCLVAFSLFAHLAALPLLVSVGRNAPVPRLP
jgi:MFS family permease